jgi:hypothetical protein
MDNVKNLPIAKIAHGKLSNPDILNWTIRRDGVREGRGFVWVNEPDALLAAGRGWKKYLWGEVRLAVVFVPGQFGEDGKLGPLCFEAPMYGDERKEIEVTK